MDSKTTCQSCGSEKVMTDVKIVDHGSHGAKHELAVQISGKPDALIFKNKHKGVLKATICGNCGRVDLQVSNPGRLWDVYNREEYKY